MAIEGDVLGSLERAWRRSDELFALLSDESTLFERPIPLRHPFVFYLGHMPAFAWNQVARGFLGRPSFDPELDDLFERGIDPLTAEEAEEVAIRDWPTVEATLAYRDRVRDELRACADDVAARSDDLLGENLRAYHVVLEHELMHHETLLYMLHELGPSGLKRPAEGEGPVRELEPRLGPAPLQERIAIPAGRATIGAAWDDVTFGWDNEFPAIETEVDAFEIDRYPTTIEAFRAFVDDGGYRRDELWEPEHFAWIRANRLEHPHRWIREGASWSRRTMFGRVELDAVGGWPVLVTGAEALAFARWKGARLPSEAEMHRAAYGDADGGQRVAPWGDEPFEPRHGHLDFAGFDPVPVGSCPDGRSAFGVDETVGNGWEWTSTEWARRPGFEAWISTYPGYSADFFSGQHAVVFGAGWFTDRVFLRPSFRNWFQRRYPYVPAAFRLAH